VTDGGRLEVIAIPGLPEIRPGDDLPAMVAESLAGFEVIAPLREDDVVVVTQKVVSKAEGAIVDLATVEPRPEAVAFAERWDRDPRQVEVVLREAAAVVRMERGVIITRTSHGFVCANGGVDASNVAPDTVTLRGLFTAAMVTSMRADWSSGSRSCAPKATAVIAPLPRVVPCQALRSQTR